MRMLIRVISQTVKSGGNDECIFLLESPGLDSCSNFKSLPSMNTDWYLIVSAFVLICYYHHYMILHYFMSDIS